MNGQQGVPTPMRRIDGIRSAAAQTRITETNPNHGAHSVEWHIAISSWLTLHPPMFGGKLLRGKQPN